MKNTYPLTVAGIHRDLPLCSLNEFSFCISLDFS